MSLDIDETIGHILDRIEERDLYLNGEDRDILGEQFKFELMWLVYHASRNPDTMREVNAWCDEERKQQEL